MSLYEFGARAWDAETKEMSYDCLERNWLKVAVLSPHVELMLYTGLQDRNDKDIYDGDILDGSYNNPMSGQLIKRHYRVVFRKGSFHADLIGHHPYGSTSLCFANEKSVVIGNIYENPKLLGGEGADTE
ncbi:YopX family protein [Paenibacillus sp. LK1]|uniref:YopX family protein n=1 Tax=Paenibacillus sp. LK1 TaxID=2053014 RepID=UPI000C4450F8|nr:YopX family protein [Paenibacillus sp. LK1]PIH58263.1 DNA-packaging protein [Paenibacillus sp. LK1]